MVTFEDRNEITVQNPPIGKATLFYDENVLKIKDENGDIRIVTLADSIENAVSSGDYYTNSYVERLKALGSPVQYSNYDGGSIGSSILIDARIILTSVYIPKISIITNIGWRVGGTQGNYTAQNYNGIGIYSINNITGDLTLLGKTANDPTIWSSVVSTGYGNKDFESPITLEKGIYFIAYLYSRSASVSAATLGSIGFFPTLSNMTSFNVPTNTFLAGYVDNQTELPLNILSTSVTKTVLTTQLDHLYYLS